MSNSIAFLLLSGKKRHRHWIQLIQLNLINIKWSISSQFDCIFLRICLCPLAVVLFFFVFCVCMFDRKADAFHFYIVKRLNGAANLADFRHIVLDKFSCNPLCVKQSILKNDTIATEITKSKEKRRYV